MMKLKIIIVVLLIPTFSTGQTTSKELESEIETFVTDSTSDIYWKKIYFEKEQSEQEFSKQELKLFYYAQGLKNVKLTPFPSLLLDQDRIKMVQIANSGACNKVIKIASELVEKNPFDLTTLIYYSMCLDKKRGDTDNIYYSRMRKIVESILESGDGLSPSSAIKIANIGDDHTLIGFMDFRGNQPSEKSIDGETYSIWEDFEGSKLYFQYTFIFL